MPFGDIWRETEEAVNNSPETPADPIPDATPGDDAGHPAPEPATASESQPAAAPNEGDPASAAGESETPFNWQDLPDELTPLAKQLQGDYTKKAQALAEQRRELEAKQQQFAGVDPTLVQTAAQIDRLIQENPQAAAEWFHQQAQVLAARSQPAPDPYAQLQYATDTERFLAERARHLEQQLGQVSQFVQASQLSQQQLQLERQFDDLGTKYGSPIPDTERAQVRDFMQTRQIPDPEIAWKALNFERQYQRGIDQGASVLKQKLSAAPPPSPTVSRTPTAEEAPPKSIAEGLAREFAKHGFR